MFFNAKSALGEALTGQKRFSEAEPLLLQGYEGLIQPNTRPPLPTLVPEAIVRLVRLYDGWDKPGDAKKWRAEFRARMQNAGD